METGPSSREQVRGVEQVAVISGEGETGRVSVRTLNVGFSLRGSKQITA